MPVFSQKLDDAERQPIDLTKLKLPQPEFPTSHHRV